MLIACHLSVPAASHTSSCASGPAGQLQAKDKQGGTDEICPKTAIHTLHRCHSAHRNIEHVLVVAGHSSCAAQPLICPLQQSCLEVAAASWSSLVTAGCQPRLSPKNTTDTDHATTNRKLQCPSSSTKTTLVHPHPITGGSAAAEVFVLLQVPPSAKPLGEAACSNPRRNVPSALHFNVKYTF